MVAALLGVLAALSVCPVTAEAIPRIRLPGHIPELPTPPRIALPRPSTIGLATITAERYGVADPSTIAALDEAGRALGSDIDGAAAEVGANAEARRAFRECTGQGLTDAGTSYREALQEAAPTGIAPAPDFDQVIEGAAGCLQQHFDIEDNPIVEMSKHLASLAAERAQEAQAAGRSGAVLAEWMTTTGPELAGTGAEESVEEPVSSDGEITPDPTTDGDGEGFPWWLAFVLVVAAAVGGWWLLDSKKS